MSTTTGVINIDYILYFQRISVQVKNIITDPHLMSVFI